jgi:hypothetical protein
MDGDGGILGEKGRGHSCPHSPKKVARLIINAELNRGYELELKKIVGMKEGIMP